jgi:D-alanyl-D-alanine carboxypeptidase
LVVELALVLGLLRSWALAQWTAGLHMSLRLVFDIQGEYRMEGHNPVAVVADNPGQIRIGGHIPPAGDNPGQIRIEGDSPVGEDIQLGDKPGDNRWEDIQREDIQREDIHRLNILAVPRNREQGEA